MTKCRRARISQATQHKFPRDFFKRHCKVPSHSHKRMTSVSQCLLPPAKSVFSLAQCTLRSLKRTHGAQRLPDFLGNRALKARSKESENPKFPEKSLLGESQLIPIQEETHKSAIQKSSSTLLKEPLKLVIKKQASNMPLSMLNSQSPSLESTKRLPRISTLRIRYVTGNKENIRPVLVKEEVKGRKEGEAQKEEMCVTFGANDTHVWGNN